MVAGQSAPWARTGRTFVLAGAVFAVAPAFFAFPGALGSDREQSASSSRTRPSSRNIPPRGADLAAEDDVGDWPFSIAA